MDYLGAVVEATGEHDSALREVLQKNHDEEEVREFLSDAIRSNTFRVRVERGRESATSGRGLSSQQRRRARQSRPVHRDQVTAHRALRPSARHAYGSFCR